MTKSVDQFLELYFRECVSVQTNIFVGSQPAQMKLELLAILQADLVSTVRAMINQYRLLVQYFTKLEYPSPKLPIELSVGSVLPELLACLVTADDLVFLERHCLQGGIGTGSFSVIPINDGCNH